MTTPRAENLLEKDCFECRVTGTLGCSAIGAFVFYQSYSPFYTRRPFGRLAVRGLAGAVWYVGAARWFYLPPFQHLAGRRKSVTVREK